MFIRKKIRGNSVYYELVENTRIQGRVTQRVLKYFPNLKDAREYAVKHEFKLPFSSENWLNNELQESIELKLERLESKRPLSQTVLKNLGDKFEVDMTYHSNAIEGNRMTLRETWLVLRKGITISGKSMKEHLEVTNHAEAIGLLNSLVESKRRITESDVLSLHAIILDKIDPTKAGFYRREQVYISGSNVKLARWRDIPKLMQAVYSELNDDGTGAKAIYSAVQVHYDTVKIHPFVDGNGRLARLLMNLRLMRAGYPPTVLRKEERRGYYSALERADSDEMEPLTTLIGNDISRALDLYLEAAE